jgi:hypothetical protein
VSHGHGLDPKIFLNGHSPPLQHPQPDKNILITASNKAVKIDFLRFICVAPFVQQAEKLFFVAKQNHLKDLRRELNTKK